MSRMSTRTSRLWYNFCMLSLSTASLAAFGEVVKIDHTVMVSPNKAKNKAFRMTEGSAVCDLYLTPEAPWSIRDSKIDESDDRTLWKKQDKAHYLILPYDYGGHEYVKIKGDLYKQGNGKGSGKPDLPWFDVTVPRVDLQWDKKHGDASKEEKEDKTPVVLVVTESKNVFGKLIIKAPEDDFRLVERRVTLTWSNPGAVKVLDGEKVLSSGAQYVFKPNDRTVKELDVCAVNPAADVKFTLEGEPDVVNKDRAVDYVHCVVARIEFVTPAGDPVASPKDSGDGQNEFTFTSGRPGVLNINLKAKVTPGNAVDLVADQCIFSVDGIGASDQSWDKENQMGKAVAKNGFLVASTTFSGLPARNSDFGKKKARVSWQGAVAVETDYEVFFPKFGKNHPCENAEERTANWFYYWKEGNVCGIPKDASYGALAFIVQIDDDETTPMMLSDFNAKENTRNKFDSHTLEFGTIEVGGTGKGIQCVAETVQHEMHHAYFLEKYGGACKNPENDLDGDGIPNASEETEDGIRTSPRNPDTYHVATVFPDLGNYEEYGDDEIRCRKCEMTLQITIFPERDWAKPGCQSIRPYGPCPILR